MILTRLLARLHNFEHFLQNVLGLWDFEKAALFRVSNAITKGATNDRL